MPSADLVKDLIALEGRPWAEMGRARKALNQNRLARMLKPLGIAPDHIDPETRVRGYKLSQFEEAFSRYLPSEGISNRSTVQNAANTGNGGERGLTINRTVSMLMYGLPGPLVFWFESLVDAPRPGLRPSEQGVRNPQRFAASRL